jgi:hypothetical protein
MRRVLPLVLVCLCAAATTAAADGIYFTESFGGFKAKDEVAPYLPGGVAFRLTGGLRQKNLAVEAWIGAAIADNGYTQEGPRPLRDPRLEPFTSLTMYGLDVKFLNPVSKHVELYLRGSMSAAIGEGALEGWAGRGLGLGAGAQLKGKVRALGFLWAPLFFTGIGPKVTGALWIDQGYDFYRLHGPTPTAIDAQLTQIRVGFAIGSDF